MLDVSALMSLQNACGGPLSPPDTFFDLCIAFLPVSGKYKILLPSIGNSIRNSIRNSIGNSIGKKMRQRMLCDERIDLVRLLCLG